MPKNYNGGEPGTKDFDVVDEETEVPLGYELSDFYSVGEHKELPVNIWWAIKKYSGLIGPNTLPFASDCYNRIYFFKWSSDTPQIWVLIFMSEEEPNIYFLLNSFEELIESLYNGD